jgi:hypothetical protein
MFRYEKEIKFSDCKWNETYENILIHKSDKSRYMAMLCHHTSTYYNRQRKNLLVPASIISWCLNIFGMVSTYFGKEKISEPLVILIVSLGNFIIATLTTIAENNKAGDKVELFNQTSRDYNLIASEIKQELMLPPDNRASVMKIIIETQRRYDDLMKSTPNIPENVIYSFINKHRKDREFLYMVQPENIINMTSCRNYVYKEPYQNRENIVKKNDFFLSTLKKPNDNTNNIIINEDINNIIMNEDTNNNNYINEDTNNNNYINEDTNNNNYINEDINNDINISEDSTSSLKTIKTDCSSIEIKQVTENIKNIDNGSESDSTIDLTLSNNDINNML